MARNDLKTRFSLMALFVAALVLSAPCSLFALVDERPIRVATHTCPPFVMQDTDGFSGLSIFLWDNIAGELGLKYSVQAYDLQGMLDAVAQGRADLAVSCLSITREREEFLDFSNPFYTTHLAIAVKQQGFMHAVKAFLLNRKLYLTIGTIIGVAALIGGILFGLDRGINARLYSMPNRGGRLMEALFTGLLFITSGPIRYYEFRTFGARLLAAFLAVGSTIMIAGVTALLASAFTVEKMRSDITRLQDLAKVSVGALEATTSFEYLQDQGINARLFKNRQDLLAALETGDIDAAVSDGAILKYMIKKGQAQGRYASLSILPFEFEKQNYAFALPEESEFLEKFDQALLTVRQRMEWRREVARHIGQ